MCVIERMPLIASQQKSEMGLPLRFADSANIQKPPDLKCAYNSRRLTILCDAS